MGSIKNRKSYEDIMAEIKSKESRGFLIRKTLIYLSPISDDFEYRVAYFLSPAESIIWEGEIVKRYQELGITHECYTHIVEGSGEVND